MARKKSSSSSSFTKIADSLSRPVNTQAGKGATEIKNRREPEKKKPRKGMTPAKPPRKHTNSQPVSQKSKRGKCSICGAVVQVSMMRKHKLGKHRNLAGVGNVADGNRNIL